MKVLAFDVEEKDLPEEWKALLEKGKDSNGEEVLSEMLDDLICLAAISDVQGAMLRFLMLQTDIPQEMWEYSEELMEMVDQVLQKWERYAQPSA